MGLEAFKTEEDQRTDEQDVKQSRDKTMQTDLSGRLLADGGTKPNPQISLKEYER